MSKETGVNIYLVVSETLSSVVCEDWFNNACHEEPYCIAELVAARSRGQAKYLAWKTDKETFESDMREMPKMSVKICEKGVDVLAGIVTNDNAFAHCWGDMEEEDTKC